MYKWKPHVNSGAKKEKIQIKKYWKCLSLIAPIHSNYHDQDDIGTFYGLKKTFYTWKMYKTFINKLL